MSEEPPRHPSARRQGAPSPTARQGAPRDEPAGSTDSRVRAALWGTIPAALATELGALGVIGGGAVVGIAVGIVGVIVLHVALRRLVPGPTAVRAALLVGGPPLRYALVIVAVWYEWAVRGSGPGPALAAGVLLAFVVPMIGSVLASPRRGPGQS